MSGTASETEEFSVWSTVAEIWRFDLLGIELGRLVVAAIVFILFLGLRHLLSRWLGAWLLNLTRRTETELDDRVAVALSKPLPYLPVAAGLFAASEILRMDGVAELIANNLALTLVSITLFWALARLVDPLSVASRRLERMVTPELIQWKLQAIRIAIWAVGIATVLEIWGVRVAPIIAGFGLLGVAVALGAQDLFKNLISGVLVLSERRFRVGDWVKIDGVVEGTVEAISFRSTKVRQFDKAPVYVPNARFADGAVVNFGERAHRRIYWTIGIEYRATARQLRQIREQIEAHIRQDGRYLLPPDATLFVRIDRFAESSIDLLIYCFTKTRAWGEWLDIKEDLLLAIKEIVENSGAGFAFPSRSIYIEPTGAPTAPGDQRAPFLLRAGAV